VPSKVKDVTEFMRLARERFKYAMAVDREDREEAVEDVAFAAGDQWNKEAKDQRIAAERPVLTENRLQTFTAQVVNDGRQSKPAIRLTPLDGGTKETAEMLQGRIRHIEYESDADIAYDTSREQQVTSGRGFYRVSTRYKKGSFDQELRIERIENQFSVLFDPNAREYDRADADWCFVLTTISADEHRRRFGNKTDLCRNSFYTDQENPAPDWIGVGKDGGGVQIAEYWIREHETRTLCRIRHELSRGMNVEGIAYRDELPKDFPDEAILETREEDCVTVCQYIIDGVEILDETEWLGSYIPIVPLWGREMIVDGKRRTLSLIRFAKDPQRLLNLYVSNMAEQVGQMPKTPYIAAEGQIANHEDEWENINNLPQAVVQYRPVVVTVNGTQQLVPAPQRVTSEPPIRALVIGYNQCVDAIKAAMGIFDASLGAKSNETAGIAIERRQKEADNANFHFHDNEASSRKCLGRILLELIPIIDRGEKNVPVRSEDGKTSTVRVNTPEPYQDPESGKVVHHQLDQGEYGVAVSTGKSYTSQREEAFDVYSQIANADKNFMQIAGDILFDSLDAPGSERIAERYRKVLPPALQEQKGQQQPLPPQVQAQMQFMAQQHEALVAQVHALSQEIETKAVESASRERIIAMQEETKRSIAFAELNQQQGVELLRAEIAALDAKYGRLHEAVTQQADQQHEQSLQQQQQAHEAQQSAIQQQRTTDRQFADEYYGHRF